MSWLRDTAAVYAHVFRRGGELAARNWILALAWVAYQLALFGVGLLVAPLGIVGGLLMTLAMAACASSWLVLIEQVIRSGRIGRGDVVGSFSTYLGEVVNVFFLLFVLRLLGTLMPTPYVAIVFTLATLVFLNAVPEILYLRHTAGLALAVESYRFVGASWVEWFPANGLLLLVWFAAREYVPPGPVGLVNEFVVGLVITYAFLVRGLLFIELTTSSRRAREFQRRAAG